MGKRRLFLCLWIVMAALPAPVVWATGQLEAGPEVVRIGAVLPLSGEHRDFGRLMERGYRLWELTVNESGGVTLLGASGSTAALPVELVIHDDASDPDRSASEAERLIVEEGVDLLFGPFGSRATAAVAEVAQRHGMVLIAPSGNADAIYEAEAAIFSVLPPAESAFDGFLEMVADRSRRPSADAGAVGPVRILYAEEPYYRLVAEGARSSARRLNLEMAAMEGYRSLGGIEAAVQSLGSAGVRGSAGGALLLAGSFDDSLQLLRVLRRTPNAYGMICLLSGPDTAEFYRLAGASIPEGLFGISWWIPRANYTGSVFGSSARYARRYEEAYPDPLTYHSAAASQAGVLLQLAFASARGTDSLSIRRALHRLRATTFWGTTDFDDRGRNVGGRSVTLQRIDGRIVAVWPPEAAVAEPVY